MLKTIILGILSSIFFVLPLQAQNVTVHTDKSFYVTGEVIWYKLYLPSEYEDINTTFKMVVSDSNGDVIDSYFHNLVGDDVTGRYAIPFGIGSGYYTWTVAVLDRTDESEKEVFSFSIPIYNDLEKLEKNDVVGVSSTGSLNNELGIRFDEPVYNPGDMVKIGLQTDENIVDFSISVIDESLSRQGYPIVHQTNTKLENSVLANLENGLFFKGTAKDKSGKGKRMNQLGVYEGALNKMHLVRTNENGDFTMTLPEAQGPRAYQFAGYISNEAKDLDISLRTNTSSKKSDPILVNDQIMEYLADSRMRKKIHQFYSVLEYEISEASVPNKKEEIKPDKSYDFKEYVQFKNMGEFFNEIISAPLKFEIDGENVKATILDSEGFKRFNQLGASSNFVFEPVFIVNGKLTKNASYIYKIPFEEISKVDLYLKRKTLAKVVGNFRNYGIAVIHTNNPKFTVPVSDEKNIKIINGVQVPSSFDKMKSLSLDMPQLRSVVYWNPQVVDGAGVTSPFAFKATDDIGTFKVNIVARTSNGNIISGSETYSTERVSN